MNKEKIEQALKTIQEEIDTNISVDEAVYQIYCRCNSYIASEIKRIIKEEGTVTYYHPEIEPLYKFYNAIIGTMREYCNRIKEEVTYE